MKALFVGCHTDDIELNCGATIAKLLSHGHHVECVVLSDCDNPPLAGEFKSAMLSLGVLNSTLYHFKVRHFSSHRQEILDTLLNYRGFDIIFSHNPSDRHQDHSVCGEEVIRAFSKSSVYCFCHPYNSLSMNEQAFIGVSRNEVDSKIKALSMYVSQSHRPYMQPDQVEALCRVRGIQSGEPYAEAFEVKRLYGFPTP